MEKKSYHTNFISFTTFKVRTLWNMTDLSAGHLQSSQNNQYPKYEWNTDLEDI